MGKIVIGNILGGVNYTVPPIEIPTANGVSFYAADLQNIVPGANGYATKRGGSSILNTTAYTDATYGNIITSIHELNSSNIFCSVGSKIGKYNSGTGAFDNHITGLTSNPTIGYFGQWLNYGGYAIYADGTANIQKTDGTTATDLTTDESGLAGYSCLAEWGERIWTKSYSTLKGSALRAPTDFSTTTPDIGWWSGTVGDTGTYIKGLVPFFDMLLIGKLNQIYMLTGAPETASSTFRLTPLSTKGKDNIGFSSKHAITVVGNDLIFLDGLSIKRLSGVTEYGDVESTDILFSIREYFKDYSGGSGVDSDFINNAQFFHYKKKEQIWCSFPTDQLTRWWLIIDYSHREIRERLGLPLYSFYPMSGLTTFCFGGLSHGSVTDIYAGCEDGYVRTMDTGTNDTSTAIDSYITWVVGSPENHIQPASVNMNVKYDTACSLTPYYAMGLQDWEDVIASGNYTAMTAEDLTGSSWITTGGVAQKLISSFYANTGRSFALKLRHNTVSQTFEMRASVLSYRKRHRYYG